MKPLAIFIFLIAISFPRAVPFTQEDRDRITRLEVKVEEGFKAVKVWDRRTTLSEEVELL